MVRNTLLLLLVGVQAVVYGFRSPSRCHATRYRLAASSASVDLSQDEAYKKSFQIIDSCARSGQPTDDLYESVRYIDRNSFRLYREPSSKNQLWERCKGSWKLQLATGPPSSKQQPTFKQVPIFAFAMIDEHNFGNGIGFNEDKIILSLRGNHYFNEKKRQMGIGIDDMFLFSSNVSKFLPSFITDGMGLGKKPEDFTGKSKMPAFTMIGAR